MDPYIEMVQTLFNYARAQFKDLKTFFFHNTIYDTLWEDPPRRAKPLVVEELGRLDPDTRFIIVGDASMAPYELMATDGSIHLEERSESQATRGSSLLAKTFRHSVWLNPNSRLEWPYTRVPSVIREILPMYELTLDWPGKPSNT
jgi:uncharacterized protein with von Willebrand factor type A (vWA) domain